MPQPRKFTSEASKKNHIEDSSEMVMHYMRRLEADFPTGSSPSLKIEKQKMADGNVFSFTLSVPVDATDTHLRPLKMHLQRVLQNNAHFKPLLQLQERSYITLMGVAPRMNAAIFRNDRERHPQQIHALELR